MRYILLFVASVAEIFPVGGVWAIVDTQPATGHDRIVALFEDNSLANTVLSFLNEE